MSEQTQAHISADHVVKAENVYQSKADERFEHRRYKLSDRFKFLEHSEQSSSGHYADCMEPIRPDEQPMLRSGWVIPSTHSAHLAMIQLTENEVIDIVREGDLYLSLQGGLKVRVSSQTLKAKSRFFAIMLASDFAEGQLAFDTDRPPSLPLRSDNVDTVLRLCQILHECYYDDDDQILAKPGMASAEPYASHEDAATARQAVLDLAQLAHKWDCHQEARAAIVGLQTKVVDRLAWPWPWSRLAEVTFSYFLEDREAFRKATAYVIARCDDGDDLKPLVWSKEGITSVSRWPDLLDLADFRTTLSRAVDSIRDRFLDNLQLVVDRFHADQSRWYLNPIGWMHSDPFHEKWRGRAPPSLLQDYIDHFHEYPYLEHDTGWVESEGGGYQPLPTLLSMIKTVERLNEGVYRHFDTWPPQRYVENEGDEKDAMGKANTTYWMEALGWKQYGLYLKSDDGSETLMYFYDAVKAAINDACSTIDHGVCMEYTRAGAKSEHDACCVAYPCWEQKVPPLDLEALWEKWRLFWVPPGEEEWL